MLGLLLSSILLCLQAQGYSDNTELNRLEWMRPIPFSKVHGSIDIMVIDPEKRPLFRRS